MTIIAQDEPPLVVDLDGTLIRTDMLIEDFLGTIWLGYGHLLSCVNNLKRGRQHLKSYLAEVHKPDYTKLPYNGSVIQYIKQAKAEGRCIYLATASNDVHAKAICDHLGLFDGYFASDNSINLKSARKTERLVQEFGHKNFDYIGNSNDDLAVWEAASKAIVVSKDKSLLSKLHHICLDYVALDIPPASLKTYAKALRLLRL